MVGYYLLRLKSIETSLKAIVQKIRFTNGSVERIRNVSRVQCRTISGVSSTSTSVDKNIVYSRHQDFDYRSQTVIQRIFEKASLWPNLTAMVSSSFKCLKKTTKTFWMILFISGMRIDWPQIHVRPINSIDSSFRQFTDSDGI
jgi:hypothetical protein